ncbi:MAG: molybdenum cofactor biosynthesis protein MoaE [Hyphomonas sp.]|nr:molybdenum cofactor biosynthesis protein MoaE [Hyphomonas sp.]
MDNIQILDTAFSAAEALAQFEARAAGAGAIVSFTGLVRPKSQAGEVTGLYLQAYSPLTETGIAAAAKDARRRWNLTALCIIHRVGDMVPGDAIVFVATASAHRRAAFEAADFLMDYLKTEAVFWKKETTPKGETWIEPRLEDYADRKRWSKAGT